MPLVTWNMLATSQLSLCADPSIEFLANVESLDNSFLSAAFSVRKFLSWKTNILILDLYIRSVAVTIWSYKYFQPMGFKLDWLKPPIDWKYLQEHIVTALIMSHSYSKITTYLIRLDIFWRLVMVSPFLSSFWRRFISSIFRSHTFQLILKKME